MDYLLWFLTKEELCLQSTVFGPLTILNEKGHGGSWNRKRDPAGHETENEAGCFAVGSDIDSWIKHFIFPFDQHRKSVKGLFEILFFVTVSEIRKTFCGLCERTPTSKSRFWSRLSWWSDLMNILENGPCQRDKNFVFAIFFDTFSTVCLGIWRQRKDPILFYFIKSNKRTDILIRDFISLSSLRSPSLMAVTANLVAT